MKAILDCNLMTFSFLCFVETLFSPKTDSFFHSWLLTPYQAAARRQRILRYQTTTQAGLMCTVCTCVHLTSLYSCTVCTFIQFAHLYTYVYWLYICTLIQLYISTVSNQNLYSIYIESLKLNKGLIWELILIKKKRKEV